MIFFLLLIPLSILILLAGLIPAAQWQADDYITAAYAHDFGLAYLWHARIDSWSPRPFSESVFYLYERLAAAWHTPLVVPFLALLWMCFIASTLISGRASALRWLIGLTTACVAMLGPPLAQTFFWPAGAVAYLLTATALTLAVFLVVDSGPSERSPVLLSMCFLASAASSESGAVVAILAVIAVACFQQSLRAVAVLVVPTFSCSAFVFWTLHQHRAAQTEALTLGVHTHRLRASLEAIPHALGHDLSTALLARLLLFFGIRGCWSLLERPGQHAGRDRAMLVALAGSLLVAGAITIALSVFQFGTLCCERHDTLRQICIVLGVVAFAVASLRWPARHAKRAPLFLAAACVVGLVPLLGPVWQAYVLLPRIVSLSEKNWQSGYSVGRDMTFHVPPPTTLTGTVLIPRGHFADTPNSQWTVHAVMSFFHKRRLAVLPDQPP